MPISNQALAEAHKFSLDWFLKNEPVDQIGTSRPWLKKLRMNKANFGGGKEHVVVQLQDSYIETGQWYHSEQPQTFTKGKPVRQGWFAWRAFRDGFYISDDDLIRNGLTRTQDNSVKMNKGEAFRLTNLFKFKQSQLMKGWDKQLDAAFHKSGSTNAEAVKALDHLISQNPTADTVGSIAAADNTWWRNWFNNTALTSATIMDAMETGFRNAQFHGSMVDYISMGEDALDVYRDALTSAGGIQRWVGLPMAGGQPQMDGGVGASVDGGVNTGLHFKGVPIVWDPVTRELDAAGAPTNAWKKRIYMINCEHIREMPIDSNDEISYTMPSVYSTPELSFHGRKWKGAIITDQRNAHWVGHTA